MFLPTLVPALLKSTHEARAASGLPTRPDRTVRLDHSRRSVTARQSQRKSHSGKHRDEPDHAEPRCTGPHARDQEEQTDYEAGARDQQAEAWANRPRLERRRELGVLGRELTLHLLQYALLVL